MRVTAIVAMCCVALTVLGGCNNQGMDQTAMTAQCPECGSDMSEGQYCASCNAIASSSSEVIPCPMCGEMHKTGTYCAKCNRFVFPDRVQLPDGSIGGRGSYDLRVGAYTGLEGVDYCAQCKKPHAAGKCPICGQ